MSLDEYKLPSLKDKIREQANVPVIEETKEEKKESKVVVIKKGRRLSK